MQKKCPKCGKNDMRVWDAMNGKMFLQCKACHWTSKDLPWTREAKEEWNHLNPGWESPPKKPEIECNTGYTTIYRCPSCKQLFAGKEVTKYCFKCGQKFDWEEKVKDKTCKTCRHNDDFLCEKKGIWITDDYGCNKWESEQATDWRDSMLARFLRTR